MSFSKLSNDPLGCLKDLVNLTYIYLYQAYDGEELHFEEGGFRRLKELRLRNMDGLKAVKIDGGAMPLLEEFEFGTFPLMKEMPTDVQRLTNLKSRDFRHAKRVCWRIATGWRAGFFQN